MIRLDNSDIFLLNMYYNHKHKLYENEIVYCETLIKEIVLEKIERCKK